MKTVDWAKVVTRARAELGDERIEHFSNRLRTATKVVEDSDRSGDTVPLRFCGVEDFRIENNTYRPHSSLDGFTPFEFAEQWRQNQTGHSPLVDH